MFKYICTGCNCEIDYYPNMPYDCPKCSHNVLKKVSFLPRQYEI